MRHIFSDNFGNDFEKNDVEYLKELLSQPFSKLSFGSGDFAISTNDQHRLVFFKLIEGIFIMYHPDYLAPKVHMQSFKILKHFVGGQEMEIPSSFLLNNHEAFVILSHYIQTGNLHEKYQWTDFTEDIENYQS